MAVDAQGRDFIGRGTLFAGAVDFLNGSAVRIMACGAIHASLVVRADFPVLPAKACVTVTAPAKIGGCVDGHGRLGVIGGRLTMTGLAGHTVLLEGGACGVIAGRMANETGTRLALLGPFIQKCGVVTGLSVSAILPGHLVISMAYGAIFGCAGLQGGRWGT